MGLRTLTVATAGLGALVLGGGLWWMSLEPDGAQPVVNPAMHGADAAAPAPSAEDIAIPASFSAKAEEGRRVFAGTCAACHGEVAAGTTQGPPLVHKLYEPSHHPDEAIALAVRQGVRAHHWRFGNMPPVEGVSDAELGWIIAYVRELQQANEIF
jgi:mono/diheme cytochrome c family protein